MTGTRVNRCHAIGASVIFALMAAGLAGCGSDDSADSADTADAADSGATGQSSSANTGTDEQPARGGTLTFLNQTEPPSLDPASATVVVQGAGQDMYFHVFGALLIQKDGRAEPLLAESMETTDDGTTWLLKLRPGMTFSDGTPFDADAVVYNWDHLTDPEVASAAASSFANVASYEATDSATVTITLKEPNTQFPFTVTGAMSYIGSPTAMKELGEDFGNEPVGGGPFVLEEWVRGNQATYMRNPSYIDADSVYLDEVVVRPVPDDTQKANAFSTGAANLLWTGQVGTASTAAGESGQVTEVHLLGNIGVMYNTKKAPFDQTSMMVAFAQAMDRTAIARTVWEDTEDAPAGLVGEASSIYDPDAAYAQPDLEAAQEVVDAYTAENGPIRVSILHTTGNQKIVDSATLLKAQLERLDGVTIDIEGIDQSALVAKWGTGDWTMTFNAISATSPEPQLYNTFHSSSGANFGGYSNPQVDAALESIRTMTDAADIQEAYAEIQRLITADGYFPPFHNSSYYLVNAPAVKNLEYFNDGVPRTDLIWLDS